MEPPAPPPIANGACIPLEAEVNGIWWDAQTSTVLLTDDRANRIARWRDGKQLETVAKLPVPGPGGGGMGQVIELDDGRLVVPRWGNGTAGDLVVIERDGTSRVVTAGPAVKGGIGASSFGDQVYVAGFRIEGDKKPTAVARVNIYTGAETPLEIPGLQKAIGVLVINEQVFVSDQGRNVIYQAPLDSNEWTELATLPSVDLLEFGPYGTLFTGGTTGEVFQISRTGEVTVIAKGLHKVHGIAYDADNFRVIAVDVEEKAGGNRYSLCAYALGEPAADDAPSS